MINIYFAKKKINTNSTKMRQTCNAKGVFAINYRLMNHNYRTAMFAVATGPIQIENISLSLLLSFSIYQFCQCPVYTIVAVQSGANSTEWGARYFLRQRPR